MKKIFLLNKSQLIPRVGKEVRINDEEIVLFMLSTGEVLGIENYCKLTHAPISLGTVSGDTLYEPIKDYRIYLRTGKMFPPEVCDFKTYPISIEGEKVYLMM